MGKEKKLADEVFVDTTNSVVSQSDSLQVTRSLGLSDFDHRNSQRDKSCKVKEDHDQVANVCLYPL